MSRWKKLTNEQLQGANYALRLAVSWPGFRGAALKKLNELIGETYREMSGRNGRVALTMEGHKSSMNKKCTCHPFDHPNLDCPIHSAEWEQVGNNDLRFCCDGAGGFYHVTLRDADDGDVIVVNEDDVEALRDKLTEVLGRIRPVTKEGYNGATRDHQSVVETRQKES